MSLASPVPLASFWDKLRISSATEFQLLTYRRKGMTGEGDFQTAELGDPKWTAKLQLRTDDPVKAKETIALINAIVLRDLTFLAYDKWNPYPAADPLGAIIGSSTIRIKSVGLDNRSFALKGFAAGYKLTGGDRISVPFASTKIELFEAVESVTANGIGETVEFEITPTIWVGIAAETIVSIKKPVGKFKIVDGSYSPGTVSADQMLANGIGFEIISEL
jgi:hypothetical protein